MLAIRKLGITAQSLGNIFSALETYSSTMELVKRPCHVPTANQSESLCLHSMDRLPADRVIAIALDNSSASRKDILPNVMQMVTSSTSSVCSWPGNEVIPELL